MRKYTHKELKIMIETLNENKNSLSESLSKVNSALGLINNYIDVSHQNVNTEVLLPENLIEVNFSIRNNSSIKWKDGVLEILRQSDGFLSTNVIYTLLYIKHPIELNDRRKSIKTISSTLLALIKDGKVGRITDESGRFIFGNSKTHFTPNGLPNKHYIEKKQL